MDARRLALGPETLTTSLGDLGPDPLTPVGRSSTVAVVERPARVWWAPLESVPTDPDCLSARERARAATLGPRRRREFEAGRTLLRLCLGRVLGAAPADVPLTVRTGKPPGLRAPPAAVLSVSHAAGLVACGFASSGRLGVDLEAASRPVRAVAIALRRFAPEETRALRALPEEQRGPAFLALFTLKEAYLKALGLGISGGLARASFAGARPGEPVTARLAEIAPWSFRLDRLPTGHLLAVAACGTDANALPEVAVSEWSAVGS